MSGGMLMRLTVLGLAALSGCCEGRESSGRVDRSYQLAPIPLINGVQGVQYIPMVYSEIPTVLVPKPIGMDLMALHSTPASSVVLPPQSLHQKYYESSTYPSVQEPVLHPKYERNGFGARKNKHSGYATKRPTYYNFGRKKIVGHSTYPKVSSLSIEPSIDITDQLQLQASFPSTTPSPASTYGPAKAVDHQHKSNMHVTTYIRPKGHHVHPQYHPKEYRVFSHMHKGHIHNHFLPPSYPLHKTQYHSSVKPAYPVLAKPTPAPYTSHNPALSYHSRGRPESATSHVRFPDTELKKSLLSAYRAHQEEIRSSLRESPVSPHSDITQAVVKEAGTISNYDASIPVRIPSKKPNQFEVKEILRNADVHFVDGSVDQSTNTDFRPQLSQFVHGASGFRVFDPSKTLGHAPLEQGHGIANNHIDYLDQREASSFAHSVRIPAPENLSTSPSSDAVAAASSHSTNVQRAESSAFTPSSTKSDWIPMSAGQALASGSGNSKGSYLGGLLTARTETTEATRIITSNRNIGDIISGKIPQEFAPFGEDIVTGNGEEDLRRRRRRRRKGSVLDDSLQPSSPDTSNLVVSSMIKFS